MKKNKVFVNKIDGDIGNNQNYCEVNDKKEIYNSKESNVENKLNELFNTNGYIFNIKVKIVTDKKIYNTRIASRVGNNIITLDNDVISINEIKDIIF